MFFSDNYSFSSLRVKTSHPTQRRPHSRRKFPLMMPREIMLRILLEFIEAADRTKRNDSAIITIKDGISLIMNECKAHWVFHLVIKLIVFHLNKLLHKFFVFLILNVSDL